ncbi:hypothetical protein AAG906_040688 [Vitis piasezkii]
MADFKAKLPKKQTHPVDHPGEQWWTLHVDEASKVFGSGKLIEQAIHINFSSSNNEAKYEVVLVRLDLTLIQPKGATPFTLAYGMEVIIPTEIGISTAKIAMQYQRDNNKELIKQLDWADEKQEATTIQIAFYHQKAIVEYNKRVRP